MLREREGKANLITLANFINNSGKILKPRQGTSSLSHYVSLSLSITFSLTRSSSLARSLLLSVCLLSVLFEHVRRMDTAPAHFCASATFCRSCTLSSALRHLRPPLSSQVVCVCVRFNEGMLVNTPTHLVQRKRERWREREEKEHHALFSVNMDPYLNCAV